MKLAWVMTGAALAVAGQAFAFGTINGAGQNAEHEKITRAALQSLVAPKTLDALAGKSFGPTQGAKTPESAFGAVGAPDRPYRGLMSEPDAHCDGGDFLGADYLPDGVVYPQDKVRAQQSLEDCRDWMLGALDRAATLAAPLARPDAANAALNCPFDGKSGSVKCQVLEELGLAFHAAQDFYSHTNWTDKPAAGLIGALNPPGMGKAGPAPFIQPRSGLGAPIPDGLISGCYDGFPEWMNCTYGLMRRARVKHEFLNKDKGKIETSGATGPGTTPRGEINDNFKNAVTAAIADTKDKYAYFEERLLAMYGEEAAARIKCVMRSDDPKPCLEKPKEKPKEEPKPQPEPPKPQPPKPNAS